ncbi:MAG: response regulator, partial [Desulfovibrionaceae bacterium]|nr:response regulator [Desulfovibrionaceae bacterium]
NKIKLSSNHLLSLINDVLEMSRIESGRIEIQSGEVNLPALLYNLTAIVIGQVEAKHHTFDINTLDIKDEDIISDKLRLNQILLNLIGNSIKYTPEHGHIELNIAELNRSEDLATFEFRVKDNGYGMSKEFAARIFEAFERENDETINKIQGTGLGMSITKHLIDLMNGTIELKTEKNKGSEFIITFPFKISDTKNENVEVTPEIKGLKILVVTKDASISKALASLLKDLEAKVTVAENSEETLLLNEQFAKNGDPCDVYLLDQELPDHTALNLAKELCQSPHTTHSDLILITAYDWLDIKEEALKAGFKAFCHRPIFASSLYPALRTAKGAPETEKTQNQEEAHDFKGKRVLLVDDIDVNREIGLTVLEMYGFEVEEAKDGQEALEMVEKAPAKYYDVVLMDVQMPRMNGMEATKAIRALKDPLKQSVPIVAMTANAFDEDRKNALAWGMNGHNAKPLDMDKLLETLAQIL